jgi:hypothetical protein
MYVTTAKRDAVSTDIDDYNLFAATSAGATPHLLALATNWRTAVVSTTEVDARDNTNTYYLT